MLIPILKSSILSLAPERSPGYVEAILAVSEIKDDRVIMTLEAYSDIRKRFPAITKREYTTEEAKLGTIQPVILPRRNIVKKPCGGCNRSIKSLKP